MSAAGWPGDNCRGDKPGSSGAPAPRDSEATMVHHIAELGRRWRAKQDERGVWRYWDTERREFSVAVYHDEATAAAGARITAAYAILEYAGPSEAQRKATALMVAALQAACRGECDYSLRKQQDALAAAVAAGLAEGNVPGMEST